MRNSNAIDKMHCEVRSDAINLYSRALMPSAFILR
jgi:hypothetical protein